jgi:hypothetical protein
MFARSSGSLGTSVSCWCHEGTLSNLEGAAVILVAILLVAQLMMHVVGIVIDVRLIRGILITIIIISLLGIWVQIIRGHLLLDGRVTLERCKLINVIGVADHELAWSYQLLCSVIMLFKLIWRQLKVTLVPMSLSLVRVSSLCILIGSFAKQVGPWNLRGFLMSGVRILVTILFVSLELGRLNVQQRLYHFDCVFSLEKTSLNLINFEVFNFRSGQPSTIK